MEESVSEQIEFPAQKASDEDFYTDDEALIAARKAFGINYLYPWQSIVIANILDAFLLIIHLVR